MDVHGPRAARVAVAPDVGEQHVARQHAAPVFEQVFEEQELLRGERHPDAARRDGVGLGIDDDRSIGDRRRAGRRSALRAAEQRPHARDQLVRAERLGHVVVGAELEADDAVGFLGARRQHDDRDRRGRVVGAHDAADFEAVHLRQHQVQDHQVRRMLPDGGERLAPRRQHVGVKSGLAEVVGDQIGDVAVVFHDEHAWHGPTKGKASISRELSKSCPAPF